MQETIRWVHVHHVVRFHHILTKRMVMQFEENEHIT
jgi:hypothetical protein